MIMDLTNDLHNLTEILEDTIRTGKHRGKVLDLDKIFQQPRAHHIDMKHCIEDLDNWGRQKKS